MVYLANGFVEQGFSVDLVLVKAEGPYLSLVSSAVQVVDLSCSRILFSLPSLIHYLKIEKPKAILSTQQATNIILLLACHLTQMPSRVVVRPTNNIAITSQSSDFRVRLMPLLMRLTYKWADGIISVSQDLKQQIIEITGVTEDKIHTIPNPAITNDLIIKCEEPLDHPWFQPNQPPVILGVGRLTPQKDFPTLIRAFVKVRSQQTARLVILGEGEDKAQLESLTKQLGVKSDVSFPGFVENPFQYMKRASVFVLSSRWEGMPNVLLQAMACETPVVATNCPTGPREILEDGKWGKLVPVGDVENLSQVILEALAGKLKVPSRKSLEEQFGIKSIILKYLSVLNS